MKFKNITQLLDHFKDEATCRDFLEYKRWQGVPKCPHCASIRVWRTDRGFKCANKECCKKFSVISGTVYENTKIPLRIWFAAIYLCSSSKKGISSLQASRQLGITQKSAWFLLHRVRELLTEKAPKMLRGVAQVDESYVGGKEHNKHASKKQKEKAQGRNEDSKTPILGLVDSQGQIVVKVLPFVSKRNITKIIHETIEPNTVMVTDAFILYRHLERSKLYKHVVVNHSEGQYVNNGYHTNSIEGFFGIFKRGIIGIYHFTSRKHLQRYCNEFASRYNTRKIADDERFELAVENCSGRLKYDDLTKNN